METHGANPGSAGLSAEPPEAAREPQQSELPTDVQTEPSCSCVHPQSVHAVSLGKIEWKMSVWASGLLRFSGKRAFAAKNVSNQA